MSIGESPRSSNERLNILMAGIGGISMGICIKEPLSKIANSFITSNRQNTGNVESSDRPGERASNGQKTRGVEISDRPGIFD